MYSPFIKSIVTGIARTIIINQFASCTQIYFQNADLDPDLKIMFVIFLRYT